MKPTKIKKTYRLSPVTVSRIKVLKEIYSEQGFDISDSQIIDKAVACLFDYPPLGGVEREE